MAAVKKLIYFVARRSLSQTLVPSQNSKLQKGDTKSFHTEEPTTLRAALQNLGPTAIWHPEFVHPCTRIIVFFLCVDMSFSIFSTSPNVEFGNFSRLILRLVYLRALYLVLCCATNRKVAGSIPAGVIGIFH